MKSGIHCVIKLSISSLAVFLISFLSVQVSAQDNRHILDSLEKRLETANDSEKIRLVAEHIVRLMDCKDSVARITRGEEAKRQAGKLHWDQEIANANRALGDVYFNCMKNYAKAFEYFQENVALAQKNSDKIAESGALETIATRYQTLSQNAKALSYFHAALSLDPDDNIKMGVLGNMGFTYTSIGDYPHALSCYTASLKVLDSLMASKKSNELQDTMQMAGLLLNIADVYLLMSQPDKSSETYTKALKIGEDLNDKYVEVLSLSGIGKALSAGKNYSRATEYYLNALLYCDSIGNRIEKGKILPDLAKAYLYSGNINKALECAQSALKLSEQYNLTSQMPKALTALAMVYLKNDQYKLAVSSLQQAVALSQKIGAMDEQKEAWQALSTTYKQMGKYAEALDAYTNFISIRDSLHSIDKANELTRIDLQYTFDAEKLKQKAAFDEKIARQRIYTYVSFGGVALVLLLAFFMYKNYNTQKKYNALLKKEKQRHLATISAQDHVLSDIAHVQSHFVRGPIATIIGLLQFYNYEDPADPLNKELIEGVNVSIEKLDNVVKDLVAKENALRRDSNEQ